MTQPVARHAIPLNFLSRHRKLSSQALEGSLAEAHEALVQLLLVLSLRGRDLLNDTGAVDRGDGAGNGFVGEQTNVAVLIIVYVNF